MKNRECEARQYSDQMMCNKCGLQWDINDDDPPLCNMVVHDDEVKECTVEMRRQAHSAHKKFIANMKDHGII